MSALFSAEPHTRRAMTVADVDAVLDIETRAYAHPWTRGNFIDSLAAGYLAEVLLLGARGQARVVGYFLALVGVGELHLLNLTVAPEWQGRGLGHALLDGVQAAAGERGHALLWLEVRASNQTARTLYQRRGFVEVGVRRAYYPVAGGREDAIVMRLALDGRADGDGLD